MLVGDAQQDFETARRFLAATPDKSPLFLEATGVKHLCGFNYRFVPAVRLARGDKLNAIPYHLMGQVSRGLLGHLGRADVAYAKAMA